MSRGSVWSSLNPFDRVAVAGVFLVALVPMLWAGSSLSVGLADAAHDALTRASGGCSDDMSTALTPQGELVCVASDSILPQDWVLVEVGD